MNSSTEAEVFGVSLSKNGAIAMTGSDDRTARVWRLSDGALLHKFEHGNQVKTVAVSDDGSLGFSAAQREDAVVWGPAERRRQSKTQFPLRKLYCSQIFPERFQSPGWDFSWRFISGQ